MDNRVSAHAARFVANCVIAYNSTMLNALYKKMLADKASETIIGEFLRISPIAWNHIIFTGRYNFKNNNTKVDLEKMIDSLEEKLRKTLWKNS